VYAGIMSRSTTRYNQLLDGRKRQLLAPLVEDSSIRDVLEIGVVGSGANLPYYPRRQARLLLLAGHIHADMTPSACLVMQCVLHACHLTVELLKQLGLLGCS